MGYGRGDSFPFDFETNGIPFGSKSRRKLSSRSYPIRKENGNIVFSVHGIFQSKLLTISLRDNKCHKDELLLCLGFVHNYKLDN